MTGRTRSTTDNDVVKIAYARNETEAEFVQNLLRDAEVGSVVRRARGFDVPEFLAAGPRDVLVAASDVPVATFCARLTRVRPGNRRGPAPTGRRGCSPGC